MTEDTLLQFLKVGLIDLAGDDARLAKLRQVVQDLTAALLLKPSDTSFYTLVAADPSISSSDPTVVMSMDALRARWETVSNAYKDTPVAIVRAILLSAASSAARQKDGIAVAFVNAARNCLPYLQSGNEKEIWENLVDELEAIADARAEREWATPSSITVSPPNIEVPPIALAKSSYTPVNVETLTAKVASAVGPVGTDPNPHLPNSPQAWVNELAPRLAKSVAEAIDTSAKSFKVSLGDTSAPLKEISGILSAHVENALAAVSTATIGLQRRTNLLWWKEALFSPSARISYRKLSNFDAAGLMAVDMHKQVPTFSPATVSAFLEETIVKVSGDNVADKRTVLSLTTDASRSSELRPLRDAGSRLVRSTGGRGPLLAVISKGGSEVHDSDSFVRLAGLDPNTEFTASEWGIWLFRELQAARAASEVTPTQPAATE